MRRLSFFLISTLLLPGWGAAEHNPLLPRPQEIRYGSGQLPVQGLTIRFASAPSAEDRFAAEALNGCLARRGMVPLAIAAQPGGGVPASIVLKREGEGPALPMPDERPGPESREAYELSVTAQGVEVRAPSSTGLFYGVQTLCQLAESGSVGARLGAAPSLPAVEIRDWPALAYRGVMVDMSHGPLPTEAEVSWPLGLLMV